MQHRNRTNIFETSPYHWTGWPVVLYFSRKLNTKQMFTSEEMRESECSKTPRTMSLASQHKFSDFFVNDILLSSKTQASFRLNWYHYALAALPSGTSTANRKVGIGPKQPFTVLLASWVTFLSLHHLTPIKPTPSLATATALFNACSSVSVHCTLS
jgi:hypothetical protein